MSKANKPRERITTKDIMNIMGFKKTAAHTYYRRIKAYKQLQANGGTVSPYVFVDDLSSYSGLNREVVKAGLVD